MLKLGNMLQYWKPYLLILNPSGLRVETSILYLEKDGYQGAHDYYVQKKA